MVLIIWNDRQSSNKELKTVKDKPSRLQTVVFIFRKGTVKGWKINISSKQVSRTVERGKCSSLNMRLLSYFGNSKFKVNSDNFSERFKLNVACFGVSSNSLVSQAY